MRREILWRQHHRVTIVHSPDDGGYYIEETKFRKGRWMERRSTKTWPLSETAERAFLNKYARFGKFE